LKFAAEKESRRRIAMDVLFRLGELGVVPVIRIDDAASAPDLAGALVSGGLPCAEITFRTEAAERAIAAIDKAEPQMLLGAGTVLTVSHAEKAVAAGAKFIVSPGFDPKVVDWCIQHRVAVIPGIATATEALMALGRELLILKFFPSEALGGVRMLEAMAPALVGVRFVPTGGITTANLATYLKLPMVHAVGGTWLATSKMIAAGAFEEIQRLAHEATGIVQSARMNGGAA
jgi:2-dehydro-3-deoxyphosphogluconate aldolase / (4S)-4-hydroxy-2-oxoglutarate aldolase